MPTPNGITLCPFFDHEGNQALVCEDTARRFKNEAAKLHHKDTFCDKDWKACAFAKALGKAYEDEENGIPHAVTDLKLDARRSEIISLNRRLTKLEHKMSAASEEVKDLRAKNHDLDDALAKQKKVNRTLNETKKRLSEEVATLRSDVFAEVQAIAQFYESRLSFMMDTYSGGMLSESAVEEWAKGKEFKIVSSKGDDGTTVWSLLFKDEQEEK